MSMTALSVALVLALVALFLLVAHSGASTKGLHAFATQSPQMTPFGTFDFGLRALWPSSTTLANNNSGAMDGADHGGDLTAACSRPSGLSVALHHIATTSATMRSGFRRVIAIRPMAFESGIVLREGQPMDRALAVDEDEWD